VILLDTIKIHLRGGSDLAPETLGQPSSPGAIGHVDTVYD
jgi:hypothetical protein